MGRKQSGVLLRDVGAESSSRLMLARRVVKNAVSSRRVRTTVLSLPVECFSHTCRSSKARDLISHCQQACCIVEQTSRRSMIDSRPDRKERSRKAMRRSRRLCGRRKVKVVGQLQVVVVVPTHGAAGSGTTIPSLAQMT